jgi:hypothetical protein
MQISAKHLWLEETQQLCTSHQNKTQPEFCGGLRCYCCLVVTSVWSWIHKRFILRCASSQSALQQSEKEMTKLDEKCKCLEQQQLLPTGKALIVFNFESHAKNMLRDHNRMPNNIFLRMCLQLVLTHAVMRRFHQITCVPLSICDSSSTRNVA